MNELAALVRGVPGFPRPGVLFRDVPPLLADARAFARCIDALAGRPGGELVGASVVIELTALQGRGRWPGHQPLHSLLR